MLRVSTEEDNYQDLRTPPRSPSNSSMESAKEDSLIRCHSLKSPKKRNDLRSSAIIRCGINYCHLKSLLPKKIAFTSLRPKL